MTDNEQAKMFAITERLERGETVSAEDLQNLQKWYIGEVAKLKKDIEITKLKKDIESH